MIITTAKRSRSSAPRLLPLAAALCAIAVAPASRADWSVRPAVELRETYTDNVALRPDNEQAQWVTEISPGLEIEHRSSRLNVKSVTRLNYFMYADERVSGTNRFTKQFQGTANAKIIQDLLYVDASGTIMPRSVSAFGPQATDNNYSSANQTEVSTWSIAPSLVRRFGSTANLLVRYTFDTVDAGNSGFGSSDGNTLMVNLGSGTVFKSFGWNLMASRQEVERFLGDRESNTVGSQLTTVDNALLSTRYGLSRTLQLTASAGYDKYDFGTLGGLTQGSSWSTGFAWAPTSRTSVQMSVGKRYIGSSNSLNAQHRSRRTVWRIVYNEDVSTMRSNYMLPATFDTAALLDRMFLPNFPDPIERQQAVADYIRESGLPGSLVDNITFLSNRFFLKKQLTASVGYKMARTNATLSLFRTRSDALTNSTSDSAVLGQATSALNDNTRKVGANLSVAYTLSPRSKVRFSQSVYDNVSLSADGRKSKNSATRIAYTRELSRDMVGALELRRRSGSSSFSNFNPYRENAISASLSYQR